MYINHSKSDDDITLNLAANSRGKPAHLDVTVATQQLVHKWPAIKCSNDLAIDIFIFSCFGFILL